VVEAELEHVHEVARPRVRLTQHEEPDRVEAALEVRAELGLPAAVVVEVDPGGDDVALEVAREPAGKLSRISTCASL